MVTRHWHVVEGSQGGYLPDSNDATFGDREFARRYLLEQAAEAVEQGYRSFWIDAELVALNRVEEIVRLIQIIPCSFDECLEQER